MVLFGRGLAQFLAYAEAAPSNSYLDLVYLFVPVERRWGQEISRI